MKVIECISHDIEYMLDKAEDFIKNAVKYQLDYPAVSKSYYAKSVTLMSLVKEMHDDVVSLITAYKAEKGEPPAPMMAIYNYEHGRHMDKAAAIKNLQDLYKSNT